MREINAWTFISKQRFPSLVINSNNTQMTITVEVVPNEL